LRTELSKEIKNLILITTLVMVLVALYLLIEYIFPFFAISTKALFSALSPFILAVIIAVIIDPLVNTLEQKFKLGRSLAVLLSIFIVVGIFSVFLVLISSRMVIELMQLSGKVTVLNKYLFDEGYRIVNELRSFITTNPLPLEVQEALQENILQFVDSFKLILGRSTELLIDFVATLPLIFTIIVVSAVATFFISKDKELITNYFINLVPAKALLPLNKFFKTMSSALTGFLRAQLFLVSMTAIQAVLGLYLLGVDFAITMGVLVGIVDLIPVLGPGIIFIPWALWYLLVGNLQFGISLIILYTILIIVRQLIEPKILGDSIGLHPLATLMSVFVGLRLMGMKGIFIGPIIILVLKLIIQAMNKRRRK
jgi:sporulation integral membrane protein YtvI